MSPNSGCFLTGAVRYAQDIGGRCLVARKVYPTVPSKVEYRLTEIGRSLVPLIAQLTEWAQTNMKTIVKHRKAFEAEAAE